MKLGAKISLAFSGVLIALLGGTLALVGEEVERREVARIQEQLGRVGDEFRARMEERREATLKLLRTITRDQKYRSFLAQIKENFYPFTEEIARDVGGDVVFMSDDAGVVRALAPARPELRRWLDRSVGRFGLEVVFDEGRATMPIVASERGLHSSVSVPLKESLRDGYAVAAITVADAIDDRWVGRMIGAMDDLQVLFFSAAGPVAANSLAPGLRPAYLTAAGTARDSLFTFRGERQVVRRVDLSGGVGYLLTANLDRALAPFRLLQERILLYGLVAIGVGLLLSLLIARRIVEPLKGLVAGTEAIARGEFDRRIDYRARDEVGSLAAAFDRMTRELEEKEFIRSTFNRYLNPNIVRHILADPSQLKLGGERQLQSVLFSDLAGFTRIGERMAPDELIRLLNEYLSAMTGILNDHAGILDKYIGDAVMAYWGPLSTSGDHARLAALTALHMQRRLAELRREWRERGMPELHCRIGIATGEMIVGNIGSDRNCNYTCIGDTVNLSSRLEGLNKLYGTGIIIDERTRRDLDGFCCRPLDTIRVKGREEGSVIFELMGEAGECDGRLIDGYCEALAVYYRGEFATAAGRFETLAAAFAGDPPSRALAARCRELAAAPPPRWDGVYRI